MLSHHTTCADCLHFFVISISSGNFLFDTDSIINMSDITRSAVSTGIGLPGFINPRLVGLQ